MSYPLRSRLLRLYHTTEVEYWHASVCKTAIAAAAVSQLCREGHAAENIVLVNLDCDRIMGVDMVSRVHRDFSSATAKLVVQYSGLWNPDTIGTIACAASAMLEVA